MVALRVHHVVFGESYLLGSSPRARALKTLGEHRQHNGELTQGAWKTSRHRPWVMQMIVYGFPSKLVCKLRVDALANLIEGELTVGCSTIRMGVAAPVRFPAS